MRAECKAKPYEFQPLGNRAVAGRNADTATVPTTWASVSVRYAS